MRGEKGREDEHVRQKKCQVGRKRVEDVNIYCIECKGKRSCKGFSTFLKNA